MILLKRTLWPSVIDCYVMRMFRYSLSWLLSDTKTSARASSLGLEYFSTSILIYLLLRAWNPREGLAVEHLRTAWNTLSIINIYISKLKEGISRLPRWRAYRGLAILSVVLLVNWPRGGDYWWTDWRGFDSCWVVVLGVWVGCLGCCWDRFVRPGRWSCSCWRGRIWRVGKELGGSWRLRDRAFTDGFDSQTFIRSYSGPFLMLPLPITSLHYFSTKF